MPGDDVVLDALGSNHLARVLRVRLQDPVTLFNGDGYDYRTAVTAIDKRVVTLTVLERNQATAESPLLVELGLALSKGERFDWAIQKATELGVSRITPLLTERVEVRVSSDRMAKKQQHWQQVVISACEQSGRAVVPKVEPATALNTWCNQVEADCKLVLHHHAPSGLTQQAPKRIALLIGPEGGLSDADIAQASSSGFTAWRIGPRVLRTETAPAVALALLGARWGDLKDD
mgnify:CR=1 FL=1